MTATINASTSAGVVVTSDTSGSLALQSNGTTIATISSTGLQQNVGAPAFSAYPNGSFSASANTWTIVPANTEEFDTNSNFNNTGSTVGSNPAYSFLPTVAGYYQVSGTWSLGAGTTFTRSLCAIYKNGSLFKQGLDTTTATATGSTVSALIYLNGSTDYIGFYLYETGTGTNTINAGPGSTYFQACMVRSA
jgi:hypothetical protein